VEIIPSGQGCAGAHPFLSLILCKKVWETMSVALMLIAAACVSLEPESLSPEHSTSNPESRMPGNPKLKEFLVINLNRKFFNWPASPWHFPRLTLAAKHISTDAK
jgi:hypothetical protein